MVDIRSRLTAIYPLVAASVALPVICWLVFGKRGEWWWTGTPLAFVMFGLVAGGLTSACHIIASIANVHRYLDGNGQVEIVRLWRERRPDLDVLMAMALIACVPLAMLGCAYIADYHRSLQLHWIDAELWAFERPLFNVVWQSWAMAVPLGVWECVYHGMWMFVVTTTSLLVMTQRDAEAVEMAMVAVAMFYVTQLTALVAPTAGPGPFDPQAFAYMRGSVSFELQSVLAAFERGDLQQNGLIVGQIALPSMHVALAWLAATYLVTIHRAFWPVAAAAVSLIWLSTLVLGWHYAVDGVAGIAMAIVFRMAARIVTSRYRFAFASRPSAE